jgi:hypothetical protein
MSFKINKFAQIKATAIAQALAKADNALEARVGALTQEERKVVSSALKILHNKKDATSIRELGGKDVKVVEDICKVLNGNEPRGASNEPKFYEFGITKAALVREIRNAKQNIQKRLTDQNKKDKESQTLIRKKIAEIERKYGPTTIQSLKTKQEICGNIAAGVRDVIEEKITLQNLTDGIANFCPHGSLGYAVLEEIFPNLSNMPEFPANDQFYTLLVNQWNKYEESIKELETKDKLTLQLTSKSQKLETKIQEMETKLATLTTEVKKLRRQDAFYSDMARAANLEIARRHINATTRINKYPEAFQEKLNELSSFLTLCDVQVKTFTSFKERIASQHKDCLPTLSAQSEEESRQKRLVNEYRLRQAVRTSAAGIDIAEEEEIETEEEEGIAPLTPEITTKRQHIQAILNAFENLAEDLNDLDEDDRGGLKDKFQVEKAKIVALNIPAPLGGEVNKDLQAFEACLNLAKDYPMKEGSGFFRTTGIPTMATRYKVKWQQKLNQLESESQKKPVRRGSEKLN